MHEDILKLSSDIPGLKYVPQFRDVELNFSDYISLGRCVPENSGNGQFSDRNGRVLKWTLNKRKDAKCIVEIGVARKWENSSTELLCGLKPNECQYIGLDLDFSGKMQNQDKFPNCLFIGSNSKDQQPLKDKMKELGLNSIDILMIDGDHSVDFVLNDWKYSSLLSDNGVVILHDTSEHPGPNLIFDAIDETLFRKKKFFQDRMDDWGIAVAFKI